MPCHMRLSYTTLETESRSFLGMNPFFGVGMMTPCYVGMILLIRAFVYKRIPYFHKTKSLISQPRLLRLWIWNIGKLIATPC
jgi:hypothetical protein